MRRVEIIILLPSRLPRRYRVTCTKRRTQKASFIVYLVCESNTIFIAAINYEHNIKRTDMVTWERLIFYENDIGSPGAATVACAWTTTMRSTGIRRILQFFVNTMYEYFTEEPFTWRFHVFPHRWLRISKWMKNFSRVRNLFSSCSCPARIN